MEFRTTDSWEMGAGIARDVSPDGMRIETVSAVAPGSAVVVLSSVSAEADAIRLPGIVRWCGDGGFGVQFGSLGEREFQTVAQIARESRLRGSR